MTVASVSIRIHPHAYPLRRRTRALLVALEGFVGLGALYGGINLITDAEGFGVDESWLEGTPFPDYTIPGGILFVVIGGGMLAAAVTALIGSKWAALAALCMGVTLLIFLTVETVLIGYQGSTQIRLLAVAGIPALVLVAVGSKAVRNGTL